MASLYLCPRCSLAPATEGHALCAACLAADAMMPAEARTTDHNDGPDERPKSAPGWQLRRAVRAVLRVEPLAVGALQRCLVILRAHPHAEWVLERGDLFDFRRSTDRALERHAATLAPAAVSCNR